MATHLTKDLAIDLALPLRARDADEGDNVIVDANGGYVASTHSGDGYRHQLRQIIHSCNKREELLCALEETLKALDYAKERDSDMAGMYHCPAARALLANERREA